MLSNVKFDENPEANARATRTLVATTRKLVVTPGKPEVGHNTQTRRAALGNSNRNCFYVGVPIVPQCVATATQLRDRRTASAPALSPLLNETRMRAPCRC